MSNSFATPCTVGHQGSSDHGIFPGKNTGVGCHFILQGIFPTQRSNLCLLHWQVDSLPLGYQGSAICFIHSISGVYVSTPISQFILPLASLLGAHVFVFLYLCACFCFANKIIYTIFLNCTYIYINMWYLFFSFWLNSFCVTVSRSILGLCLLAHFSLHYILCSLGMFYLFPLLQQEMDTLPPLFWAPGLYT